MLRIGVVSLHTTSKNAATTLIQRRNYAEKRCYNALQRLATPQRRCRSVEWKKQRFYNASTTLLHHCGKICNASTTPLQRFQNTFTTLLQRFKSLKKTKLLQRFYIASTTLLQRFYNASATHLQRFKSQKKKRFYNASVALQRRRSGVVAAL